MRNPVTATATNLTIDATGFSIPTQAASALSRDINMELFNRAIIQVLKLYNLSLGNGIYNCQEANAESHSKSTELNSVMLLIIQFIFSTTNFTNIINEISVKSKSRNSNLENALHVTGNTGQPIVVLFGGGCHRIGR